MRRNELSPFHKQNAKHIMAFKAFLLGGFTIVVCIVKYQTFTKITKWGD